MNQRFRYYDLIFLASILIISVIPRIYLFTPLPLNVDSSGFIYAATNKIFPHGPYFVYIWICSILAKFFEPVKSIAILSFVLTLLNGLIYFLIVRIHTSRPVTWLSTAIFLLIPISIRIGTYQEVYPLQLFFILLSFAFLQYPNKANLLLSGLSFGIAFSTHHSSLFILPALMLFLVKKNNIKSILIFLSGFFISAAIPLIWFFYQLIHIDISKYTNDSLLSIIIKYYTTGTGDQYLLNLEYINEQIFEYLRIHIYFLTLPIIICAVVGFVLSYKTHRYLWYFGLAFSLPFVLFELPRKGFIDGGLYYVFLVPTYSLFTGIFLYQIYRRLENVYSKKFQIRIFNFSLPQIIFIEIMFIWIVLSPNYLYDFNVNKIKTISSQYKQIFEPIKRLDYCTAVIIPYEKKFDFLHRGRIAEGNFIELLSGSIPIYRIIDKNGFKTFFIIDPDIKGWKFQWCRILIDEE